MADRVDRSENFVLQAGILAAAGIITRIIGLLYRSPLDSIIGELGLGYYSSAYNYYTIILLISSYSIPAAISKVMAQKLGAKEYINAYRLFKCALAYVLTVGGAASLFLWFGAGLFVEESAIPVLRTFAPTVFIYGILGVLRGYFQAHKSMVQTSISQIIEQIINAGVSIGMAYLLIKLTFGTMELPATEEGQILRGVRGAMGSAMGTGAGVLVALLFMAWLYFNNRQKLIRKAYEDNRPKVDSIPEILKIITFVVTPFILSTFVYNLNDTINNKLYMDIYPSRMRLNMVDITSNYGIFSGKVLTISKIPIAFASAMASAMIPSVAELIAMNDQKRAREKIALAVKSTMLISIPCAFGIFALAKPVTKLIFPATKAESLEKAGILLMAISLSIIFYALSTLNSSILQGLGKVNTPIINAAAALAVQTITAVVLLFYTPLDLYSIAVANTLYSGIMCVLNQWAVRRAIDYRQEIGRTFIRPGIASALMALMAYIVYRIVYQINGSMVIALLPAIIVAVPVYFIILVLIGGVNERELRSLPKGHIIVKALRKLHILK
ncbi:MAG: polysaccharide biosynthesis protein [Lachnospiraceae bacterium]|nr:polysaccharide biosynthesis protein [Lachnospiraceae bacterium]